MFYRCKYWRLCQSLIFFGGSLNHTYGTNERTSLNINWPKEIVWKAISKWGIHWYISNRSTRKVCLQETMQIFGSVNLANCCLIWFDGPKFGKNLKISISSKGISCLYGCRLKKFSISTSKLWATETPLFSPIPQLLRQWDAEVLAWTSLWVTWLTFGKRIRDAPVTEPTSGWAWNFITVSRAIKKNHNVDTEVFCLGPIKMKISRILGNFVGEAGETISWSEVKDSEAMGF